MKTWQEGFNDFISHRAGPVVVELQVGVQLGVVARPQVQIGFLKL